MLHKDHEIRMPILIGTYPYVKRNATKSCVDDFSSSSVPYPKDGETHNTAAIVFPQLYSYFFLDPPTYEELVGSAAPYRPVYHVYRRPVVTDG